MCSVIIRAGTGGSDLFRFSAKPAIRLVFAFLTSVLPACPQGIITTVAGSTFIFPVEAGPAVNAPLGEVWAVAVDSQGNFYITDFGSHLVLRVSRDGTATVIAGNSTNGYSGDGGPATSAALNDPRALAVDGAGNVFIADTLNHCIRKVSRDGIITTIAGSGAPGFSGDGGPASAARLAFPQGLALDAAGNLYVSDSSNFRVRRIGPDGIITTIAGTGLRGSSGDGGPAVAAMLAGPAHLAVDAQGNVLIADPSANRIRRVSAGGVITTVAGTGTLGFSGDGGPATSAALAFPRGVAVDAGGNIYIPDDSNNRIRRVNAQGIISTIAGFTFGFSGDGGPAVRAELGSPGAVAVDSDGSVLVADSRNHRIRRIGLDGTINTVAGGGSRFFGDGGPATSAALDVPNGVALDAAGNLIIADEYNHRIRKVTPEGVITTVAGNGVPGLAGDGGPATEASLKQPRDVAVDPAGNIYIADALNHRVRRISTDGNITTVAGTSLGFSGDGGPATQARLAYPDALAVDSSGNLYISDVGNARIRKVSQGTIQTIAGTGRRDFTGDGGPATSASHSSVRGLVVAPSGELFLADTSNDRIRRIALDGTINTVAGTGTRGFSGDGGPATSAAINGPEGLALDAAGNLYFADWGNSRIRRLSTDGRIGTIAGSIFGFGGDGGSPTQASLRLPRAVALDGSGNVYISDGGNSRIRAVIVSSAASFTVAPATLSFSGLAGSAAVAPQQLNLAGSISGLVWQATVRGANWLRLSSTTGPMPAAVSVAADATSLPAGTHTAGIEISAPAAVPSLRTVSVTLTVAAAPAPQLSLQPANLSFHTTAGVAPPAQSLRVENTGGGTLNWTARATVAQGSWLSISATQGTATGNSPGILTASVNPRDLTPGAHSGTITVTAGNQSVSVPVTLVVAAPAATLLLSQSSLLFRAVEGGGVEPPQTFGVLNIGAGSANWTASTTAPWLRLSLASGRSEAGSTSVPLVTISVDPGGLGAGFYGGLIRIESAEAGNSPQVLKVDLQVLTPGTKLGAVVRPTGLIFFGNQGSASPGSQDVLVATTETRPVEFVSQPIAGPWVRREPDTATTVTGRPARIVVQPEIGTLSAGVYRAGLTVFTKDDGVQYPVNLLLLLLPSGTSASGSPAESGAPSELASAEKKARSFGQGQPCANELHAQFTTVSSNFNAAVGYPSAILVNVRDGCGTAAVGGAVILSFSNGDPAVALTDLRNGLYSGAWRPGRTGATVILTARASWRGLEAQAAVTAQVGANPNPQNALLSQGGVVLGAGFERGPVSPGSIISLFGSNFAQGNNVAAGLPLPRSLAGVRVLIGETEAPLFFVGPGQINAQVPAELPPEQPLQVRVEVGGVSTAPEPLQTARQRPGLFTLGPQFGSQGAIIIANTNRLAMPVTPGIPSQPAEAGTFISIYCTGLGETDPAVASGQPGPAGPLALVRTPATVTIGGLPAEVTFAGMAPGFVGVYQVNARVPAAVTPGDAVPVVVSQAGAASNTVTIAVR